MTKLTVEVSLDAPVERIWELLTDFSIYPQWNPLFTKASVAKPGEGTFDMKVHLPGMAPFDIKPKIVTEQENKALSWESRFLHERLFTWTYCLELDRLTSGRIRVGQISEFSGLLSSVFDLSLHIPLKSGMEQLAQALKRWTEKGNVQCLKC